MSLSRIAVLTSGGDAPGMNAAIRAVVRLGNHSGVEVLGVEDGYQGLLNGRIVPLAPGQSRWVAGIERHGGTILGTARSEQFRTEQGQRAAREQLDRQNIEALVVIGGEGSSHGALRLHEQGFPVVVVPASIDNDVGGTAVAIGVDTAINTALDAIDRLQDTATAFHRAFLVEVMGRDSGWLALQAGVAAGVEMVLVPEVAFDVEAVIARMKATRASGRTHFVLVSAEGIKPTTTAIHDVLRSRQDEIGFESRLTILGHIQRGGPPTAFDRLLATQLAARAVDELMAGRSGTLIGFRNMRTITTPLAEAIAEPHAFSQEMYQMVEILAG